MFNVKEPAINDVDCWFFFALGSPIDGLEGDICHVKFMANCSIQSAAFPRESLSYGEEAF
jgi:hypothetical protein